MAIEFEHGGKRFRVDTPEEAATLLNFLDRRENAETKRREYSKSLARLPIFARKPPEDINPWTPDVLADFIARLGTPQKAVLQVFLLFKNISDVDLCAAIGVKDNQALAGVLSGVSKQALAANIPPRAIFRFENSRAGGKRSSRYEVADEFLSIARDVGWPAEGEIIPLTTLDNA